MGRRKSLQYIYQMLNFLQTTKNKTGKPIIKMSKRLSIKVATAPIILTVIRKITNTDKDVQQLELSCWKHD